MDYNKSFVATCEVNINANVKAIVKRFSQRLTYGGLSVGAPSVAINDMKIDQLKEEIDNEYEYIINKVIIVPERRNYLREHGDMDSVSRPDRPIEWLPMLESTAFITGFGPDVSQSFRAVIAWYQQDYSVEIDEMIRIGYNQIIDEGISYDGPD